MTVRVFVLPDLHGRSAFLTGLLRNAGIVDADGERVLGPDEVTVVSIGDIVDGSRRTVERDREMVRVMDGLVDFLVLGNHEWPFFGGTPFGGFVPDPDVRSALFGMQAQGRLVPAMTVGDTLLTHAGVERPFDFATAEEARDAVQEVFDNQDSLITFRIHSTQFSPVTFGFERGGQKWRISQGMLLGGVPSARGGPDQFGGVLWSDWDTPRNANFSQVLGHTPQADGPVLVQRMKSETYTINLDAGAKSKLTPYGVWLDGDGDIIDFVEGPHGKDRQEDGNGEAA